MKTVHKSTFINRNHKPEIRVVKNLPSQSGGQSLSRKLHCEDYVQTFSLRPFIRLGVEVQHLQRGNRCWRLALSDGTSEDFDFVVLAVGNFNQKFLPEVPGAPSFMGQILHSSDLLEPVLLREHHVVIVGYGKSALEPRSS